MFTISNLMAVIFTVQLINIRRRLTQGHKVQNNNSYAIRIGSTKSNRGDKLIRTKQCLGKLDF
jgi:hypothetical protein